MDECKVTDAAGKESLYQNLGFEISDDEIQEFLAQEDLASVVGKIKDYFSQLGCLDLNIAITGESGSGKSTFINAFRGLGDEEEGSAETGVVEMIKDPTPYPYPKYPNIQLWDLPGIGTPNFRADEYLRQVGFQHYDFFIIIAADRFRECHAHLANEIIKMGKRFYFVRSKIDSNIDAEKRRKKTFNEENTLDKIRKDCIQGLKNIGVNTPVVFLISCFDLALYDFNSLEETMKKDLPQHKRHVLMLALPNISREINERKMAALQKDFWKLALLSVSVAILPIPLLSFAVDVAILVKELKRYYNAFSLEPASLQKLSDRSGKSVDELKAVMKSPLHAGIDKDLVIKLLSRNSGAAIDAKSFPALAYLLGDILPFSTVYRTLKSCLDGLVEDAHNVLMLVLQTSV